jgi:hypothetical protein
MTTPSGPRWGASALHQLANAFVGQEHVGALGGLLVRLSRYLGGDAAAWLTLTSSGTGNVVALPDNTNAQSVTLTVTGNPVTYRIDGSAPVAATDPQLPVGAIITITGRPTIQAFRFVSTVATPASLVGAYYD